MIYCADYRTPSSACPLNPSLLTFRPRNSFSSHPFGKLARVVHLTVLYTTVWYVDLLWAYHNYVVRNRSETENLLLHSTSNCSYLLLLEGFKSVPSLPAATAAAHSNGIPVILNEHLNILLGNIMLPFSSILSS